MFFIVPDQISGTIHPLTNFNLVGNQGACIFNGHADHQLIFIHAGQKILVMQLHRIRNRRVIDDDRKISSYRELLRPKSS